MITRDTGSYRRELKKLIGTDSVKEIRKEFPELTGVNATSKRFWKIAYSIAMNKTKKEIKS